MTTRKAPQDKLRVGRHSKYDPAYCAAIVKFCVDGVGIIEFAAEIGVSRGSLNNWAAEHPEFLQALNTAKAQIGAWWSAQSRAVGSGGGGNGQAAMVMFALKNHAAEDYQDITKQEHTGKDGAPIEIALRRSEALALIDEALREPEAQS
jgi:hypothetical protein